MSRDSKMLGDFLSGYEERKKRAEDERRARAMENFGEYINYLESRYDMDDQIRNELLVNAKDGYPLSKMRANYISEHYRQILLEHQQNDGIDPLFFAVLSGDMGLLRELLKITYVGTSNTNYGIINYIIDEGLIDSLEIFIQNYCRLYETSDLANSEYGASILYKAVQSNKHGNSNIGVVNLLLSYGVSLNINTSNSGGKRNPYPLCAALSRRPHQKEVVDLLVNNGSPVTYSGIKYRGVNPESNIDFPAPIFYCVNGEAVHSILQYGDVDINAIHPETGETFLHETMVRRRQGRAPGEWITIITALVKYKDELVLNHRNFKGKNIYDDERIAKNDLDVLIGLLDARE